jgi:hypothetical protein
MKKGSLTIILLVLTIAFARAQSEKKFAYGLTVDIARPYTDDYGYVDGLGLSAKIEYALTPALRLAFIPGYFTAPSTNRGHYTYANQAETVINPGGPNVLYKYIPLKMGLRYYFIQNVYVEGEAGKIFGVNSIAENGFLSSIGLGGITTIDENNFFDFGFNLTRGYRNNDFYVGAGSQYGLTAGYIHFF